MNTSFTKTTATLFALILSISTICSSSTAWAQLPGLKQFDPFNKNSKIRERARALDKARRVEGRNLANGFKTAHGVPNPLNQNSTRFHGTSNISFRYVIENHTSTTVRFRLPSGKTYYLGPKQPGRSAKRGSYVFNGPIYKAKIHIFNSGRTYQLRSGTHKFRNLKNGLVGLDMQRQPTRTSQSSSHRPSSSGRPRR